MLSDEESQSSSPSPENDQPVPLPADSATIVTYQRVLAPEDGLVYLPVHELPLPGEDVDRAPPRTIRFKSEGALKHGDKRGLELAIFEQLRDCTPPTVSFPQQHVVDVTFASKADFIQAKGAALRFNGHDLTPELSGAALEPSEVPIVIEQKLALPGAPASSCMALLGKLAQACNEQLAAQGHIIEAWAQFHHPDGQPHLREWNGKLICLFHLEQGQSLPAWLELGESRYSLSYGDRYKHCSRCEWRAEEYHETGECKRGGGA